MPVTSTGMTRVRLHRSLTGRRQRQRIGVADDGTGAGDGAPRGNGLRVDQPRLARGFGKAVGELGDQRFVAGPQPPGAVALGDSVALAAEGLAQGIRRIRSRRGAEALVASLMGVESLRKRGIGVVLWRPALVAVVGQ